MFEKNYILQYGPARFRVRCKLNELLSILNLQGRVKILQQGKTVYVQPIGLLALQPMPQPTLQSELQPGSQTLEQIMAELKLS